MQNISIDKQRVWAQKEQRKAFLAGCVIGMVPLLILIGLNLS